MHALRRVQDRRARLQPAAGRVLERTGGRSGSGVLSNAALPASRLAITASRGLLDPHPPSRPADHQATAHSHGYAGARRLPLPNSQEC